jgi:hypothetical protein
VDFRVDFEDTHRHGFPHERRAAAFKSYFLSADYPFDVMAKARGFHNAGMNSNDVAQTRTCPVSRTIESMPGPPLAQMKK